MFKTKASGHRFDYLNFGHWILPFDLAQGGESVEHFGFRLLRRSGSRRQVLRIWIYKSSADREEAGA